MTSASDSPGTGMDAHHAPYLHTATSSTAIVDAISLQAGQRTPGRQRPSARRFATAGPSRLMAGALDEHQKHPETHRRKCPSAERAPAHAATRLSVPSACHPRSLLCSIFRPSALFHCPAWKAPACHRVTPGSAPFTLELERPASERPRTFPQRPFVVRSFVRSRAPPDPVPLIATFAGLPDDPEHRLISPRCSHKASCRSIFLRERSSGPACPPANKTRFRFSRLLAAPPPGPQPEASPPLAGSGQNGQNRRTEKNRTEKNRKEQNRKEQKRKDRRQPAPSSSSGKQFGVPQREASLSLTVIVPRDQRTLVPPLPKAVRP